MSKFFIGFLTAAQLASLHAAGHAVETFALTEPQKIVATLKTTSIGATVAAEIANLRDSTEAGAQKFTKALAIAAPLVVSYVASGPAAIVSDAEGVARELVQSLYNDMMAAVKAATADTVPAVAQAA
jgi:hypothetical protein